MPRRAEGGAAAEGTDEMNRLRSRLAAIAAGAAFAVTACTPGGTGGGAPTTVTTTSTTTTTTLPPSHWVFGSSPMFVDEFDVDGAPDPQKWTVPTIRRDAQFLTSRSKNARVEGGRLVIELHAEEMGGAHYTTAMLGTPFPFLHGRFEARMKLPTTAGMFPAFWLCCAPGTGQWPAGGEIDIMEFISSGSGPYEVASTLHSPIDPDRPTAGTQRGRGTPWPLPQPDTWHVFAAEWGPDEIRFFVDGQLTAVHAESDPRSANGGWPFDTNGETLRLNLFVDAPGPIDDLALPQRLEVDWVRAFPLVGHA